MVLAKILNNMNWLKENWFKVILGVSALIISFSLGFYYIYKPIINERKLNYCLNDIDKINPCGRFFGDIAQKYGLCEPGEKIKELELECFKRFPIK